MSNNVHASSLSWTFDEGPATHLALELPVGGDLSLLLSGATGTQRVEMDLDDVEALIDSLTEVAIEMKSARKRA